MPALTFELEHEDTATGARTGRVTTPHGTFQTPAFMPVGTQAAVKGLLPAQLRQVGAEIILANTYHLLLRPGPELIAQMGGLQAWMSWNGPMLTDSGGYQVFSLADISKLDDDGVTFQSHIDGATVALTPERAMEVQNQLGADIIMALDDCPPGAGAGVWGLGSGPRARTRDPRPQTPDPTYTDRVKLANERTLRWLDRCVKAHARTGEQALFGIVQGGVDLDQRSWCVQRVLQHDLPGYAIGGVAVGEGPEQMRRVVEHTAPLLPRDKPRYLMGVGYERDLVMAVRAGVDMFDCVLPTRNGRSANAFTRTGQIRLKNARFRDDPRPIEEGCDCIACGGRDPATEGPSDQGAAHAGEAGRPSIPRSLGPSVPSFSRSYLRHLFLSGEMLGPILVSAHNIRHFQRLMLDIRGAIRQNDWSSVARRWPVLRAAALA
ncbi:MAG: tRNA guanosine(34) transglycosylase Tgt [Phycisphaeraceae bacterium]